MKKVINFVIAVVVITAVISGCKKSEISSFSASPAINFEYFRGPIGTKMIPSIEYSFLTNTSGEVIQNIPVIITGGAVDYDRHFSVEIVQDSMTTARPDQYEILETTVHANQFIDTLRIKLLSSDELDDKTVSIKLRMVDSDDFKAGILEKRDFDVSWTNQVVVPTWGVYFRTFFTASGSSQAYRVFVQTTGLTDFQTAQFRLVLQPGAEALGTLFGDSIMRYNRENKEQMVHDDGAAAGQPIVPVYFTKY